jgi:hypothetical protein
MTGRIHGVSLAVSVLFAGCGAGVAGVAASSGNSGGGDTPALTTFEIVDPKVSPALLRLEASAGVVAEFFFERANGGEKRMTALRGPGVSGNRVQLPAGAFDLTWEFATELGSPEFVSEVELFARHLNGRLIRGGNLKLGIGNDPPRSRRSCHRPANPTASCPSAYACGTARRTSSP